MGFQYCLLVDEFIFQDFRLYWPRKAQIFSAIFLFIKLQLALKHLLFWFIWPFKLAFIPFLAILAFPISQSQLAFIISQPQLVFILSWVRLPSIKYVFFTLQPPIFSLMVAFITLLTSLLKQAFAMLVFLPFQLMELFKAFFIISPLLVFRLLFISLAQVSALLQQPYESIRLYSYFIFQSHPFSCPQQINQIQSLQNSFREKYFYEFNVSLQDLNFYNLEDLFLCSNHQQNAQCDWSTVQYVENTQEQVQRKVKTHCRSLKMIPFWIPQP